MKIKSFSFIIGLSLITIISACEKPPSNTANPLNDAALKEARQQAMSHLDTKGRSKIEFIDPSVSKANNLTPKQKEALDQKLLKMKDANDWDAILRLDKELISSKAVFADDAPQYREVLLALTDCEKMNIDRVICFNQAVKGGQFLMEKYPQDPFGYLLIARSNIEEAFYYRGSKYYSQLTVSEKSDFEMLTRRAYAVLKSKPVSFFEKNPDGGHILSMMAKLSQDWGVINLVAYNKNQSDTDDRYTYLDLEHNLSVSWGADFKQVVAWHDALLKRAREKDVTTKDKNSYFYFVSSAACGCDNIPVMKKMKTMLNVDWNIIGDTGFALAQKTDEQSLYNQLGYLMCLDYQSHESVTLLARSMEKIEQPDLNIWKSQAYFDSCKKYVTLPPNGDNVGIKK